MSNMNGYAERLRLINNKIEEYTIDLTKILKSYNEASSKMTLYQTAYEAAEDKLITAQQNFYDFYQVEYNNLLALYAPARAIASIFYEYEDNEDNTYRYFTIKLRIGSCGLGWNKANPCSIKGKFYYYDEKTPGKVHYTYITENGDSSGGAITFSVQNIWDNVTENTIILGTKIQVKQDINASGYVRSDGIEITELNGSSNIPKELQGRKLSFNNIELLSSNNTPGDKYNNAINSAYLSAIQTNISARSQAKYQLDIWTAYFNGYAKRKEQLEKTLEILNSWKTELHKMFFTKYSHIIQEGTWISEEYYDDEKYYLDAASTAAHSCKPQASYTISALELSQLPEYAGFEFKLGDQTQVEDAEFFGTDSDSHPIKEDVVLTEISYNLDNPDKNTIKVQTYKNQFQDLFKKITATVQQVKYASGAYDKTADLILESREAQKGAYLKNILTDANVLLEKAGEQTVSWGTNGITVKGAQSNELLRIINSGIFLGSPDDSDGINWKLAISSKGISAEALVSGTLDTSKISIMNGEDPTFRWDAYGLTAYNFTENALGQIYTDYTGGVRFDRFGIYGFYSGGADSSTWHPSAVTEWKSNGTTYLNPVDQNFIRSRSYFELTREGLYINLAGTSKYGHQQVMDGNHYFSLTPLNSPIAHRGSVNLGKVEDTLYNSWDEQFTLGANFKITPYYDSTASQAFDFVKVMNICDANDQEQFALYDDGTLIAKKAVIYGTVYAESGRFKGDVYADNGYFSGTLKAATGSFSGKITAVAGTIGGWEIGPNELYYEKGSNDTYFKLGLQADTTSKSNKAFYVKVKTNSGSSWNDDYPFYVTNGGQLYAKSGTIGGWTINSNYIAKGDVKLGETGGGMTFGSNLTITNEGDIDAKSLTLNGDKVSNIEKVHLSSSTFERQINGYGTINDLLIAFNAYEDNTGTSNSAFAVAASGRVFCKEVLFNAVEVGQNKGHYTQSFYLAQHDSNFGLYIDTIATSSASTPTTDPYKTTQVTTGRTGIYCATDLIDDVSAYCFPRILYTRQGIQAYGLTPEIRYQTIQNYEIVENEIMTPKLLGLVDDNTVYKFKIASSGGGTAGYITFIV